MKIIKKLAITSILAVSTTAFMVSCSNNNTEMDEQTEANTKIDERQEQFLEDKNDFRAEVNKRIEEIDNDILALEKDINDVDGKVNETTRNRYAEIKMEMSNERENLQKTANEIDSKDQLIWDEFKANTRSEFEYTKEQLKESVKNAEVQVDADKKMNK